MGTSTPKQLVIYGAGGHGRIVAEAAVAAQLTVVGFLDDRPKRHEVGQWSVLNAAQVDASQVAMHVAIGDNVARKRLLLDMASAGYRLLTVIHPTAWVSPSAVIAAGVFIGAHAVVNAQVHIDSGVIINSGAIVEHDCHIGEYGHIAPNAAIAGNVKVGALSLVGMGVSVIHGKSIGTECNVGAGAVVTTAIGDRHTVKGVPAR